jgi:hypothetical protein
MSAIFGSIRVPLRPNRTYQSRSASWEPLPTEVLVGILTVEESAKAGGKVYRSRYLVKGLGEGRFRILKSGGDEFHDVELGRMNLCSCKGFSSQGWCRHTEALSRLKAAGRLVPGLAPTSNK